MRQLKVCLAIVFVALTASMRPRDFLDDRGHFDLTRWIEYMGDCLGNSDDEMIKCVNSRQPFMQLRKPPRAYLAGALPPDSTEPPSGSAYFNATVTLPASFEVRERWPECKDVTDTIHDQPCSNCWAYSSSGVMSDRTCIASGGQVQARLSADDLTTCCTTCAAVPNSCSSGGYPSKAFAYWISNGVTGSRCKPSHAFANASNTQCVKQCENGRNYSDVLHYGEEYWSMKNATSIQQEIYVNGSVEVRFALQTDLYAYAGGVYIPTTNATNAYHSVRLIGWGELATTDNVTVPYWIAANSWGKDWGENGTFRILRGINALDIETWATAGQPRIDSVLLARYA